MCSFFFFQAEDGIRDGHVTGVQTCALPIIEVVNGGDISKEAYVGDGELINSDFLNGLYQEEAITKMIDWLEANKKGTKKISYRLRDWLFSRIRYLGEPIPIFIWEEGTMTAVDRK